MIGYHFFNRVYTSLSYRKMYVSVTISHVLQQQGKYEDDFVPTESSLQALEVEGDFMMGFFTTVYVCVCMPHTCTIIYIRMIRGIGMGTSL